MRKVKEKVSNAAAAAQEHVDIMKAKAEEVAEKATATTKEERKIAEEKRKAKEAEAQMKRHQAHAENAAEKLREKHSRHALGHHDPAYGAQGQPVGTAVPTTGVPAPTYPLGGQPPAYHQK